MHVIVVHCRTEGKSFNLVFKQQSFAQEAYESLVKEWRGLTMPTIRDWESKGPTHLIFHDDYGHHLCVEPSDIIAIFLADQEQEYEVAQLQSLDQARAQVKFQQMLQADPKLRLLASMLQPGRMPS